MSDLTIETFRHKGLTVKICYDTDLENPCDQDYWKVHSFNSRHGSFSHPGDVGIREGGKFDDDLKKKFKAGLAFLLSYYEHGNCCWMLAEGPTPAGVEFKWDGVQLAGLLEWTGDVKILPKTLKARRKVAAGFIDRFTKWCNGEGYCYSILRPCETCGQDEDVVDSCGGFGDIDDCREEAKSSAESIADEDKKAKTCSGTTEGGNG